MAPRIPSLKKSSILLLLGAGLFAACVPDKADTGEERDDSGPESDDDVPPLVSLDAPLEGETVTGDVTWAATASDNVRVSSVSFHVDDGQVSVATSEPYTGTWDSSSVTNGTWTVTAIATDSSGNDAEASASVVVANDGGLDPGAIVITSPTDGATVCGELTATTSVSGEVSQVTFSLNDAEVALDTNSPFYWDFDTTLVPDGEYTMVALAADSEGRQARDSVTFTVLNNDESCDNAPSILFDTPLTGEWLRRTVEVEVTATDDEGVTSVGFYVDSGLLVADSAVPYETALATEAFDDGAHTLKAVATDTGGQTSEAEITVYVDNTAPVVVIDGPTDGELLSGTVDFEASATDNYEIESVLLLVDGEVVGDFTEEPYAVALDTTLLSHGEHVLEAWTTDQAGNEATDTILVLVDNPPVVTFSDPTDTYVGGTVTVTAEATDDDLVLELTLSQDGEEIASDTTGTGLSLTTTLETCDLPFGTTTTYEASATDTGGNTTTESLTITVDQPLQVEIGEFDGALDYTTTLSASVSDDERISSVVFDLDGTTVASTSTPGASSEDCFDCGCVLYNASWSTEDATEGAHTLTVTVTNASGDTATDSTTVEIDYDHDGDGFDSEFYGGDDCDDTDSEESPAASEACDGADDDCDGETDEDFDTDGDGYQDESLCPGVAGAEDCDDTDADVRPGVTDGDCDGVDDNCDGYTDNSGSYTSATATFGASSDTLSGSGMAGNVYKAGTNAVISSFSAYLNPGSTGVSVTYAIYEAATQTGDYTLVASSTASISGSSGWYSSDTLEVELTSGSYYLLAVGTSSTLSRTGDRTPSLSTSSGLTATGYLSSSSAAPTTISTDPSNLQIYYQRISVAVPGTSDADTDADGYSTYCGDCDEADATVSPDGAEVCDDQDNDCDGSTDEAEDSDGDGYEACDDCDDDDASVYPGATETCNATDDDCDGTVDDSASDGATYYADGDGDGYGRSSSTKTLCESTSGWAPRSGDCDDADADINPGETETCNATDDDCDGYSDEDFDEDGDGYGAGDSCGALEDCDDTDADINPEGVETCNDQDDDCSGAVDDNPIDGSTFYYDADSDGYGDASTTDTRCEAGGGWVASSADCDDTDADVNPGETETCNEIDDDCDDSTDEGFDGDGDGYASCSECDDADATVSPGAEEECDNGVDDDCDGRDTTCAYGGSFDIATVGFKWRGEATGDYAGSYLSGGYDADGDGYDDVLVGAPSNDDGGSGAGAAYVLYGAVTAGGTLGSSPSVQIVGEDTSDGAGTVAFVGDQDGDGYDELFIGATGDDDGGSAAGAGYVVLGPVVSALDLSSADATLIGETTNDNAGTGVISAGDVNGDDIEDMLIGASGVDSGSYANTGAVYLVLGPTTSGLDLSGADAKIRGGYENDYTGSATAGGGDTDGDGYADFAIGSPNYSTSNAGYAFYFNGPFTGSTSVGAADSRMMSTTSGDYVGTSVAFMDANGDGYDDALAGAPGADPVWSGEGSVYIQNAPLSGSLYTSASDVTLTGRTAGGDFGYSLAVCEIDDDGFDDLVVGAYREDPDDLDSGVSYVFFGPITASLSSGYSTHFLGEDLSDRLGAAVACGGDTDGDGLGDIVLGAYNEDHSTGTYTGAAYLIPFAEVP